MANEELYKLLKRIKKQARKIEKLSDKELKAKTKEFKKRIANGETTDKLLPEAFAVVCEADKRVLGMYPYDAQILGGIALHKCFLAEMNTGEGKTLTATMPLYLNALTGKSTILVTANEYLAFRDAVEMGPVYEFLGLTIKSGVKENPEEHFTTEEKKENYGADILYTTHGTLGFDYLLNNLVSDPNDLFLRDFYYLIIDEADSVLLDAAQMPLVISGSPRVQSNLYQMADFFVTTLKEDEHYEFYDKKVWLTKEGVEYAEKFFNIRHFYAEKNFEINRHVVLALRSHVLLEKQKSYIVNDKDEIVLLDNDTGRSLPGMKMRGGQHQALEAKEKLEISQESRSVASITFQNLFLMFPRLAGMSGTLSDAKHELKKIYKKTVTVISPNKPVRRIDMPDLYFKTAKEQYLEAIKMIIRLYRKGQPVLVIASNIVDTNRISKILVKNKIPHSVLNANNASWEAEIIKEAGQKNAVTVSNGMAGRGTDISLPKEVKEKLGGLAVIGIGRLTNVRLERQVRGRAGRQGDPGMSQFFVSLQDEVVASTGENTLEKYLNSGKRMSKRKLKRIINGAQKTGEENAEYQRRQAVEYDKVMKRQREILYDARTRLLTGETLKDELVLKINAYNIKNFFKKKDHFKDNDINRYVLDNLSYNLEKEKFLTKNSSKFFKRIKLTNYAETLYRKKKQSFKSEAERQEFSRLCILKAIDNAWVEQVDYLQQLQYATAGRSSAQRNPVFEYQIEAYKSFKAMENTIKRDITRNIFLGEPRYDDEGKMYLLLP